MYSALNNSDSTIKRVSKSKTLGVIVDEHLSWNDQIQSIVSKSSKGIGMIRRIKKFVPQSTLLKIYNSIVLSHFDYCSLVWDNCSDYLLNKLQKLQNRAARVITGRTYETRSKDVLKELNWQPLSERLKRNKCIFMHKIKNNVMPQSVIEMFKIKENQVYQLRSNNINFSLGKPVTNFMKKSIYLVTRLRPYGTAYQVYLRNKTALVNLNLFLTAADVFL
jgi:hypothetical protein